MHLASGSPDTSFGSIKFVAAASQSTTRSAFSIWRTLSLAVTLPPSALTLTMAVPLRTPSLTATFISMMPSSVVTTENPSCGDLSIISKVSAFFLPAVRFTAIILSG